MSKLDNPPNDSERDSASHPRFVRLVWSAPAPPCEECRYDHASAETPFGPFLLTWKGWKEHDSPGFDKTPWGDVEYHGWNTVEEAQAWAEMEMERRINQCLANGRAHAPEEEEL